MRKPHQGIYTVQNKHKYKGDASRIVYRSSWEKKFLMWCDGNPRIRYFSSEEIVIPYVCKTDNRYHRYFVDFYIEYDDGSKYIIEIKPKKETVPPRPATRMTKQKKYEILTWAKNTSKWEAAMKYAESHDMIFNVWTEDKLKSLGIKILNG